MCEARLRRWQVPSLSEGQLHCSPEEVEVQQHLLDVAWPVLWVSVLVESAVVEAVLDHLEDAVVLDVAARHGRRGDPTCEGLALLARSHIEHGHDPSRELPAGVCGWQLSLGVGK